MKVSSLAAVAAAISLMSTPVVAQAASADLSRTVAPTAQESGMEGDNTVLYIIGGVLAAVGLFFILDDDDDKPSSP